MKPKTAVVLAVLLAACLLFIVVRKWDPFASKPSTSSTAPALFEKEPADIASVVVAPATGPKLVLANRDGKWWIEAPFRARAEGYKVSALIAAIAKARTGRSFLVGEKDAPGPAVTSLDKPLWTVELKDANGALWRLEVGKPVPLRATETYVRSAGNPRTFVALANLAETLRKPAGDYRNETVLQFNASQAVALALSGPEVSGPCEVRKNKDEWGIVKPYSARADRDVVRDILQDLSYLRVAGFVTDAPSPGELAGYGLEEGKAHLLVQVTVQAEAGAPPPETSPASMPSTASAPASGPAPKVYAIAFGVRTDDGKVFARVLGEPAVFQLSASTLDGLLKKTEGIRRSTILDFEPQTVSAIELSVPGGNASLRKEDDGGWTMVLPSAGKASGRAVGELLSRLSALKAQSWADPRTAPAAMTGLEKPFAKITLTLAGQGQTVTLLVGSSAPAPEGADANAAVTYVKAASATSIAMVRTSDTIALVAPAATYWDPAIFSLPYDLKATGLIVASRDGNSTLLHDSNSWKLTSPLQVPADNARVARILDDLHNVTADKVVHLGPEVPDKYAKAVYNLTVEVFGRMPLHEEIPVKASTQPTLGTAERSAAGSGPATMPAAASAPTTAPTTKPSSAPAGKYFIDPVTGAHVPVAPPATPASQPTTAASGPASRPVTKPDLGPEVPAGKLQVVKVDGKAYAWVPGAKPIVIGELPVVLYDDLAAELRQRPVWTFESNEVLGVKLQAGPDPMELRREGEEWVNALNPEEKADTEKVRAYLGEVQGISAEKFMTPQVTPEDANKLGLAKPWATLELRLAGGKGLTLSVSARGPDLTVNRYACGGTAEGIYVLSSDIIGKLAKKFADFKKSIARPTPEGLQ